MDVLKLADSVIDLYDAAAQILLFSKELLRAERTGAYDIHTIDIREALLDMLEDLQEPINDIFHEAA